MISVIIPYMAIHPFPDLLPDLLDDLESQSVDIEIIVKEQKVGRFIKKNLLLNEGIKESHNNFIFFCDADMRLKPSLLGRMLMKIEQDNLDVIYPMFISIAGEPKIADGAPLFKKEVIMKHGKLDQYLVGIGGVTFPFLEWCIENVKIDCVRDYQVQIHEKRGRPDGKQRCPKETRVKLKKIKKELPLRLREMGWWPN